jgi:hypothetical protein
MATPEQIAWRERFDELLNKWRTALPKEKLQFQVDLSDMVVAALMARRSPSARNFRPTLN